jgi:3-hydroxybutyryl-CoA dehydrogenase
MAGEETYERPAIAGSGTIATGLAACATLASTVRLLARSDASAWRAEEQAQGLCAKLDEADAKRVKVTTDPADLADCDLVVEAVIEELEPKAELLRTVGGAAPGADLATTTSSLSIDLISPRGGHPERTFGMHPFNPVVRMELIELCIPVAANDEIATRARNWCESIGKTVVEVPNEPGFVVNRLLFPYLFDAVRLMEQTGMEPEEVDRCMTLGANYPMGPLALLDLIGADVAVAIGEALYADSNAVHHRPPGRLMALVDQGKLGRKSGAGFYEYD